MVDFEQLKPSQQVAALAHDRNYAVTAGAGSGKTTTFASRYLKLLEATDADPGSIAAITFTESGAMELQERVSASVSDRLDELDGDEYDEWLHYHDELPEAYVHTIHSFCARLLREYALEADVPTGFDVIEEAEASAQQAETVRAFVDDHLDDPRLERLTRIYYRERLESLFTDLLDEHHRAREWADRWDGCDPSAYVEHVQERYVDIDAEQARNALSEPAVRDALDAICTVAREENDGGGRITIAENVAQALEVHGLLDADPHDEMDPVAVHDGAAALCEALTTDGTPYRGSFDSWYYDGYDDWDPENASRYDEATATLVEAFPVEDWVTEDRLAITKRAAPYYVALASLYVDLHESYKARKRRESVLDFGDLIDSATKLLRNSERVRDELRDRFDYVMLDEVQDTDPRQWELVRLLTSLDDDYDGLNVFVVGDEKQSIFRFRGADVTQYRAERERLQRANEAADVPSLGAVYDLDDDDADLSANFRSLPAVLEPINDLFDELFGDVPETHRDAPAGIDGSDTAFEPDPQRLTPARTDTDGISTGTSMVLVPEDETVRGDVLDAEHRLADLPESAAELDAQALACEVSAFLDGDPQRYEVVGFEDGSPVEVPTPIEPSDVAILLRKRTHLEAYERALAERDVPYTVASGVGYYERTEIVALRNLVSVLHDPTDDLSLFGLLRSPVFGFEDDTVVGLWNEIDRERVGEGVVWDALETAEDEGLRRARSCVEEWRTLAGATDAASVAEPWDAVLGRVIDDTNLLASLAVDERGQQAVANVDKFRDRLRDHWEEGVQTLPELAHRIESDVERSTREGEAAIPAAADGVRIMTIHDAKGQEFPAVFVPGLALGFDDRVSYGDGAVEFEAIDDPLTGDNEPMVGIRAPDVSDGYVQSDTPLKRRLAFHRRRQAVAEEKRILYVAATRARDHLCLLGTVRCEDESLTAMDLSSPDDPSHWFDLLGSELLDEEALAELAASGAVDVSRGPDHGVTVRLPARGVDFPRDDGDEPPALDGQAPQPDREREYRVPASYLGALLDNGANGEVTVDHTGQYVRFSPSATLTEAEETKGETGESSGSRETTLPANVFGLAVHKALEIGIDPDDAGSLENLVEQFAVEEDVSPDLVTDSTVADLQRHVRNGQSYLEDLDDGKPVDEKAVTATLEHGEVYGFVDRLVVTDDQYHVVDYKTNSIDDPAALQDVASQYERQLEAYAIALSQADSTRSVRATLLFTDAGQTESWEWGAETIAAVEREIDEKVSVALGDHLRP